MNKIVYFHRNLKAGYSVNKVTQTILQGISGKEEYFVPYFGASLHSVLGNLIYVWRHRDKSVLNHVTGDIHYCILALIGCKSILTIHDTVSLDFNNLSKIKRFLIEWLWFRLPLRLATKVVCISEETRRHVLRYTKRDDIEVIHNAVDPVFKEVPCVENNPIPTVLLIGTNPNKNVVKTCEALKDLRCRVVIVGPLSEVEKEILAKYQIDYTNKVSLTDAQIVEEYELCDIVSFLSLFEGFGMVVIEANKVGRPVICSDIPVLHEVAGDAALFVNPNNVDAIRCGFLSLFSDLSLRQSLVQKGFENVNRFCVSSIREQWISLYLKNEK